MKSFGKPPQGERLERLHELPMWDGERLRNIHPVLPGLRNPAAPRPTLRDFFCGDENRTPPAPLPARDPRSGWARKPASGLRATWLGHSDAAHTYWYLTATGELMALAAGMLDSAPTEGEL